MTIPFGVTIGLAAALRLIGTALFISRRIGPFVADCTIEEVHTDETVVTRHPVQQGARIADHSYLEPLAVTITAGWSNSVALLNPGGGLLEAPFAGPLRARTIYESLIALKETREPFSIVTGKRVYRNMMFHRITTRTDEKTENSLIVVAECREVIIVSVQTTTLPSADNQRSPEITGATQNGGERALGPQLDIQE